MKKVMIVILCLALTAALLAGCASENTYKIIYDGDEILNCPTSATAGEKVTLEVPSICDGDLIVSINGDTSFGEFNRQGLYEFIMPEEDVEIELSVDTSAYYGS